MSEETKKTPWKKLPPQEPNTAAAGRSRKQPPEETAACIRNGRG